MAIRVLWTHPFAPDRPGAQGFLDALSAGVRSLGVELELLHLGNLRSVVALLRAQRVVQRVATGFDVVHAQYGSACAFATAGIEGRPKVLSLRGNDWSVHRALGFHFLHTRLARALTRTALASYDAVLPVSLRMAEEVRSVAPHARVEAIPTPVALNRFVPHPKAEVRAALGFPGNDEKWVLFNAVRLDDPVKRYPLARRAFELASAKRPGLRLRVATEMPHAEIPALTAACDAILVTSESEGWPNCVKEALACNVPFVTTDVSDLRLIADVEPTCRICPPDPERLAQALCEVLDAGPPPDLRRHVAGMSVEAICTRLVAVYESLVSAAGDAA